MLKRPSDSNSALFSVTRRDRLVYASGTVRSTAPSNAAYTARVTETAHTHTHPDSPATQTAHMQSSTDQTQRDVELGGDADLASHFPFNSGCVALVDLTRLLMYQNRHLWSRLERVELVIDKQVHPLGCSNVPKHPINRPRNQAHLKTI